MSFSTRFDKLVSARWFADTDYQVPNRQELFRIGITPYSNIPESDLTPSLYRRYDAYLERFESFETLLLELAQWVGHIKGNRRNVGILGEADDLEEFLFASSKQSLETMSLGLRKLDSAQCFYCGHSLTTADVDHYIPFSQYPRDLAHNFVLAHPACNRSKSDTLAALPHLERWLERLHRHSDALAEIGANSGFVIDTRTTQRVGSWAYANAVASGAQAWIAANDYSAIDHRYTECFAEFEAFSGITKTTVPRSGHSLPKEYCETES